VPDDIKSALSPPALSGFLNKIPVQAIHQTAYREHEFAPTLDLVLTRRQVDGLIHHLLIPLCKGQSLVSLTQRTEQGSDLLRVALCRPNARPSLGEANFTLPGLFQSVTIKQSTAGRTLVIGPTQSPVETGAGLLKTCLSPDAFQLKPRLLKD